MEAYLAFVHQYILETPPLLFVGVFCILLIIFLLLTFIYDRTTNIAVKIIQSISAAALFAGGMPISGATIRFFAPEQYRLHTSVGILILFFFLIAVYAYQERRKKKDPTYFSWYISSWQQDQNGDWQRQPALIINGEEYRFDRPEGYIYLFEEMKRRGVDKKSIDFNLNSFRTAATYRKIRRAALDRTPDPPFIPTVHLPGAEYIAPQAHTSEQQPSVLTPQPISVQQPPQPFSNSGPIQGMALKKKRGQRQGSFGKIIFTFDARMEVSAETRALIATYKLGNQIIYESANRQKYSERARQYAENASDQPGIFASPGAQAWGLAKTFGRIGAAAFNAAASSLSLRITVNSLIEGVHVECKDMNEILEAEEAIADAALNLKAYLDTAATFTGQEQIIEL